MERRLLFVISLLLVASCVAFDAFPRAELQRLAKLNNIKANEKSSVIIEQLKALRAPVGLKGGASTSETAASRAVDLVVKKVAAVTKSEEVKKEEKTKTIRAKEQLQDQDSTVDELELLMQQGEMFMQTQRPLKAKEFDTTSSLLVQQSGIRRGGRMSSFSQSEGGQREVAGSDKFVEIEALILKRSEHRAAKEYDAADAVREELVALHDVQIYDKKGVWIRGSDGASGPLYTNSFKNGFKAPKVAEVACPLSVEEVQRLVEKRIMAKRARNFDEADALREQLSANGIEVIDQMNEWVSYDKKMSGLQSFDRYNSDIIEH